MINKDKADSRGTFGLLTTKENRVKTKIFPMMDDKESNGFCPGITQYMSFLLPMCAMCKKLIIQHRKRKCTLLNQIHSLANESSRFQLQAHLSFMCEKRSLTCQISCLVTRRFS